MNLTQPHGKSIHASQRNQRIVHGRTKTRDQDALLSTLYERCSATIKTNQMLGLRSLKGFVVLNLFQNPYSLKALLINT